MLLVEIGTDTAISAYFYMHITSGYGLNVSDPIEGQPVQLPDYLFVFGCGLVFWLLVLLWAKLHGSGDCQADIRKVAKLAKLIAPITTLNLCGSLLAPFMKLPSLVRFLVLFQVSSNVALLLIWAFLSLKKCMIVPDTHTQQQQKSSPEPQAGNIIRGTSKDDQFIKDIKGPDPGNLPPQRDGKIRRFLKYVGEGLDLENLPRPRRKIFRGQFIELISDDPDLENLPPQRGSTNIIRGTSKDDQLIKNINKIFGSGKVDGVGGRVGASGSGHGSGASGSGGGSKGGDRGRVGGGDRRASGSGHGSVASGSGGGSEGEDSGSDGGGDRGASGSGHGSGARGSGGGNEGGDRDRDGGGADPEFGGRGTNTEQAFKSSKITEMSLMLTAQTTATLMGFHTTPTPSSSSKALLVVALMDQLVAYLCGLTSILLSSNKPEYSKAAKIFADIGFVCNALGFILMVAMYVPWYFVLIAVIIFGVVWLIFFRDEWKTRATKVWNYLRNSTQNL